MKNTTVKKKHIFTKQTAECALNEYGQVILPACVVYIEFSISLLDGK